MRQRIAPRESDARSDEFQFQEGGRLLFALGDVALRETDSYKDRHPSAGVVVILDPRNHIVATNGEIPDDMRKLVDDQVTANAGNLDVATTSAIVETTRGQAIMSIARLEGNVPGFHAVFFEPLKTRRSDT